MNFRRTANYPSNINAFDLVKRDLLGKRAVELGRQCRGVSLLQACRRHYPGGNGPVPRTLAFPDRRRPSPNFRRVGSRIALSEACLLAYPLSAGVSLWGVVGYGSGELVLTPEGRGRIIADMDLAVAGAGVRGEILSPDKGEGPALAVKSDGFVVRTASDAVPGELAASEASATRFRVGVEGSYRLTLGSSRLVPSLEIGVRRDGGDAETGFGVDIGAGLAWSDPTIGVAAELRARGLLSHEAGGMRERGIAGSFAWDPDPSSDRGVALTLRQTVGGSATGGMETLLSRRTLEGLAANDEGRDPERRALEARLGYGFALFGDRFTGTPELGFGMSNGERDYSVNWRLAEVRGSGLAFELGLGTTRREPVEGEAGPERRLAASLSWRLGHVRREQMTFELGLEATHREAANDDRDPERSIGARLRARW